MAVVAVVVAAEVVMRYALGRSLIVTEELSRYGMVWVALLASVLVLHEDGHVSAGGLAWLGPRGERVGRVVADLLSLLFLVVLAVASLQTLPDQLDQQTLTLGVSIFWFYLALPVAAVLMALVIVARVLGLDRGSDGATPPAPETVADSPGPGAERPGAAARPPGRPGR
jgi:TRAP-type C4-dicarboxylate transport system permease small subunit